MKKVFIRTFGCQMNEYDSEKMLAVLAEENGGIEQVTEADEADIILFNTCSVREKAQEKVFSDLGRIKHLKARGVKIGVAGCVAQAEGEEIMKRQPAVDLVVGPQAYHQLPELLTRTARARGERHHSLLAERTYLCVRCVAQPLDRRHHLLAPRPVEVPRITSERVVAPVLRYETPRSMSPLVTPVAAK